MKSKCAVLRSGIFKIQKKILNFKFIKENLNVPRQSLSNEYKTFKEENENLQVFQIEKKI